MAKIFSTTLLNPYVTSTDEINIRPDPQHGTVVEELSEYAARLCYNSVDKMGHSKKFLAKRIEEGHLDVFEHAKITLELTDQELDVFVLAIDKEEPTLRYHEVLGNWSSGVHLVTANLRVWVRINEVLKEQGYLPSLRKQLHFIAPVIFEDVADQKPDFSVSNTKIFYLGNPLQPLVWDQSKVTLLGYNVVRGKRFGTHNSATFLVEGISRACSHQFVRHRLASFCLAGDTLVPSFSSNGKSGGKQRTITSLYEWASDVKRKGRIGLINLRGINDKNEIIPVKIKSIIYSGVQKVYKVTSLTGRSIEATENHQFLTQNGWKPLRELNIGENLLTNGLPAYKNRDYLKQRYLVENTERKVLAKELGISDPCLGTWIRKFGLQKPKNQYPNRKGRQKGSRIVHTEETKEKLSLLRRGRMNPMWKGEDVGLSGGRFRANKMYKAEVCSECGSTHRVQRHHIDNNPRNNETYNVQILCEKCHKTKHVKSGLTMTVFPDPIVSIEPSGIKETYDIEIEDNVHNFVANGFVVHNSQASQRYIDQKGWSYIVPDSIKNNEKAMHEFSSMVEDIKVSYLWLRETGIRKEDARFILPNAMETKLVVSMCQEDWRHFIHLRALDKAAQWEIRRVGIGILEVWNELYPDAFWEEISFLNENRKELNK